MTTIKQACCYELVNLRGDLGTVNEVAGRGRKLEREAL
jgi:hypothetical protein